MKKIAILQSNYIPWKGYFDIINMVDEFIIYDSCQYTKNDWRNRNLIKIEDSLSWLTIPVFFKNQNQCIDETIVSDLRWNIKHWKTLSQNYSKSKYFNEYKDIFEELYSSINTKFLSEINFIFIKKICSILNIDTKIRFSREFNPHGNKTEALLNICKECDADIYLSGPSAKNYFEKEVFKQEDIKIEWMNYSNYKEYNQLNSSFYHNVTILDLIFNEGINCKSYLKSFNDTF